MSDNPSTSNHVTSRGRGWRGRGRGRGHYRGRFNNRRPPYTNRPSI